MFQTYKFEGEDPIRFDDSKSVRELLAYAFERFNYYEPAGMDIVTVFQCHHSKSNYGWFTTDVSRTCAEEIENRDELCFAYHKPDCFYFAEGGWGHHMEQLGNHPVLNNPVSVHLRFDEFKNTVVINGNYYLKDMIDYLKKTEYISDDIQSMEIIAVGKRWPNAYRITLSDDVMNTILIDFEGKLEKLTEQHLPEAEGFLYHHIIVLE